MAPPEMQQTSQAVYSRQQQGTSMNIQQHAQFIADSPASQGCWTLADLSTWQHLIETLERLGHLKAAPFRVPGLWGHA